MLPLLMRVCVFQSRLLRGLGLLLVMTAVARADADLALPSPFLPAGGAPSTAAATNGPIEYHGYMVTSDGERFSIYNTAKKTATWVGLNERGNPFVVRLHRLVGGSTDQITVDYQGGPVVLALKEAKIVSVAVPAVPAFGSPQRILPGGVTAPAVQGTPSNLPAGASLDEWAAEVQRRRLLRQQPAAQPGAPASSPAPSAQRGPQPGGTRR